MIRIKTKNIAERFISLTDRYYKTYVKAREFNDYINRMFMTNTTYFTRAYKNNNQILLNVGFNSENKYSIYLDIDYRIISDETIFINYIELDFYKDGKSLSEELINRINETFADDNERCDHFEEPEIEIDMTEEEFILFEYGGIYLNHSRYHEVKSIYDDTYRVTIIG